MSDDRFLLRRDRAVQAGAGTGKTHALVTQYLHLCAGLTALGTPLEPQRIAALTFTDKAAGEMIERLRQRVGRLMRAQPGAESPEPALAATALLLGRAVPGREHWEQVLVQLGGAPVGTFHSFAGGLLRRYPQLAGVDPDYALLDEETAVELELEAAERVVLLALEGEHQAVRSEQAAAVVAEFGFVGAGARGSAALVDWLCQVRRRRAEEGQRPDPDALCQNYRPAGLAHFLALAAGTFLSGLQQIGQLVPHLGPKSVETAQDLLRRAHLLGHLGHGAVDLGLAARVLPASAAICQDLGQLRARPGEDGTREALAAAKRQVKGGHQALAAVVQAAAAAPLAETLAVLCAAVWDAYEDAKRRVSALDFTDLLRRARDVLRDHPDERHKVQQRFGAILVDEFQDTNPLQSELLALLAPGDAYAVGSDGAPPEPAGRTEPGPGRLYLVGDRKQSIYEFRGADVGTFAGWCQAVVRAGGDAETLRVSRRSLPGVLALSNALFAQVMQPPSGAVLPGVQLGPQAVAAPVPRWLVTWDQDRDALVPLREAAGELDGQPGGELLLPQDSDETAALLAADPLGVEADLVARRIRALNDGGRRYGDVAVLLRRFTHLDRYLQALRQEGIPHYVVKGRGFYDAQEIRDLTSALALLDDPEDTLALVSVLRSPLCGLSDDSLVRLHLQQRLRLLALLKAESAGELIAIGLPAGEAERLRRLVQTLRLLLLRGDRLGPAGCLQALCEATDLQVVLGGLPEGAQRVANLELLLHRARRFDGADRGGGPSIGESFGGLRGFVRWLRLLVDPNLGGGDTRSSQAQIVDERDDVVRVMTVHQSKGLEFPVVVVPGCASRERVDGQQVAYDREVGLGVALRRSGERVETLPWQLVQRVRRQRQEAESARLFYVAVTRARDLVIFAGEGRGVGRTWRGQLEAFRRSPQGGLLGTWQPAQRVVPAVPPVLVEPDPAEVQARARAAALAIARAYRDAAPNPHPSPLPQVGEGDGQRPWLSVSAACDLAVCVRRYHLLHGLRLRELRGPLEVPGRAAASDEVPDLFGPAAVPGGAGPSGWLRRGVLAHRLLARVDLLGDGADLVGLLAADGLDPAQPQVGEVRTRVQRLLSRLGDLVAGDLEDPAERQVLRAVPFVLKLDADQLALRGVFDLLVLEPGLVTLVDYHYSYAPDKGDGRLQELRRGLLSAALRRLYRDRDVRLGLAYLRESDPAPRFSPCSSEAEQAALQHVSAGIAQARTSSGVLPGPREGLRALPLLRETCVALGCGYRYRCHGERVPAAPVESDAAGPAGLPEGADAPELPQHMVQDLPDLVESDFNEEPALGE